MLRVAIVGTALIGTGIYHAESYKPESYKPETLEDLNKPNVKPVDEFDDLFDQIGTKREPRPSGHPDYQVDDEEYDDDEGGSRGPQIAPSVVLRLVGGILTGVGHSLIAMADSIDKKKD
jgi:hypothetical protein